MTSKSTPEYIPKVTENICACKDLYMNIQGSITHNSQKVQTNIHQLMNEQNSYDHTTKYIQQ